MPKEIVVDPNVVLQPGSVTFQPIAVHAYATPFAQERAARGDATLREVLRHMLVVREFETMLSAFKATGAYRDISLNYKGPAHLSIGQEAAAVGAAPVAAWPGSGPLVYAIALGLAAPPETPKSGWQFPLPAVRLIKISRF